MDVVIDTSTITPDKSGTGVYAEGLLRELLRSDDISGVTAVGGYLDSVTLPYRGKLTHIYQNRDDWHRLLNFELLGNRINLQADIAVFPNYFMPLRFSIPSVVTIHDISFLTHPHFYTTRMSQYYKKRIVHSFEQSEAILTVSRASREQISKEYPSYRSKIRVVKPGCSIKDHPIPIPRNYDRRFVYLGSIEPRKNVVKMLQGFIHAELPHTELVLIGKMNCQSSYQARVEKIIDSCKNIQYLGYQPDAVWKGVMSTSDGVVNISHVEGFGFSILEGVSRRLPCMISRDPALQELTEGRAVTVDGKSISSIAKGFNKMVLQSAHETNGHSQNSHEKLTWQRFGKQISDLLDNIRRKRLPDFWSKRIFTDELKQAIIEGLAYSAVFGSPIDKRNLFYALSVKAEYETFNMKLEELKEEYPDLIREEGDYYSLIPHADSGDAYVSEQIRNQEFIRRHRRVLRVIDQLPWVEGLYFSGGTVHGSQVEHRDLDLFVVTSSNRIWLVYSLLKCIGWIFRRESTLCYNYLVDKEALHISYQQDFFAAHQLIYLRPVFEDREYPDVLSHNNWVYEYFPNAQTENDRGAEKVQSVKDGSFWKPLNFLNMLLMECWTALWHSKGHRNLSGGLLWDLHRIKLHTNDHRPWIYKRFYALMNKVQNRVKAHIRENKIIT